LLEVKVFNAPEAIQHFRSPNLGLEFEWHPGAKKVYLIRQNGTQRSGEAIAHDIENHGAAWNAVLIFQRGFRECQRAGALNAKV